jgi:uncharacterized protein YciI
MSDQFDTLKKFLMEQMTMSHVYQPVMVRELLRRSGSASIAQIAQAILDRDPTQIDYFSEIVKNMVGRVLTKNRSLTDKQGCGHIRAQHLQKHIEWLETNKEVIPVGGSLRVELGQVPKGGLWIAEADSKQQLDDLLKTDPFYTSGLRQSYEILHWSKANDDRKVLI